VISTDCPPLEGWNGTAPQGCIIPPNFSDVSSPPWSINYCSLPDVGNYPEPVAAVDNCPEPSNIETEVRYKHLVGL